MIIQELTLHHFRCFEERTLQFNERIVVIQGYNGSGKSSLLEALHYCCYLRSFRTHLNRELVRFGNDYFFIQVRFNHNQSISTDQIQIGFSEEQGKVVKSNQKIVVSYKDLISQFKVVTLVADDIELIQGSPELRRYFLNYALLLDNPGFIVHFKRYKQILEQRNSLLSRRSSQIISSDEFLVWTEKLWRESLDIRQQRCLYLQRLEVAVNKLLENYFAIHDDTKDLSVSFEYAAKNFVGKDFADFWQGYQKHHTVSEQHLGRSLFGVHLDDFIIIFRKKRARAYASRGQQKLLVLLIKIAQLQELLSTGEPGVLLLDDFVTDFDSVKMQQILSVLKDLQVQVFLSSPVVLFDSFEYKDIQNIRL